MKYLKMFESNRFNLWTDVIDYIKSTLVSDKEEFDNIFLEWSEHIQGKCYSTGGLSMPKFVFHRKDYIDLVENFSPNIFDGGLNSKGSGITLRRGYDLISLLNAYIISRRQYYSSSFTPNEFSWNDFRKFYKSYGILDKSDNPRHSQLGYELVIDWTIYTDFESNFGHPNTSDEFLEVESIIQEVVSRMEQFFGLKYTLFTVYPHDVAIFNIYFYK